jgi:hypothetical protein
MGGRGPILRSLVAQLVRARTACLPASRQSRQGSNGMPPLFSIGRCGTPGKCSLRSPEIFSRRCSPIWGRLPRFLHVKHGSTATATETRSFVTPSSAATASPRSSKTSNLVAHATTNSETTKPPSTQFTGHRFIRNFDVRSRRCEKALRSLIGWRLKDVRHRHGFLFCLASTNLSAREF